MQFMFGTLNGCLAGLLTYPVGYYAYVTLSDTVDTTWASQSFWGDYAMPHTQSKPRCRRGPRDDEIVPDWFLAALETYTYRPRTRVLR